MSQAVTHKWTETVPWQSAEAECPPWLPTWATERTMASYRANAWVRAGGARGRVGAVCGVAQARGTSLWTPRRLNWAQLFMH